MPKTKDQNEPFSDEVREWAKKIVADPQNGGNPLLRDFSDLADKYGLLLKRFNKVARISDSYQAQLKDLNRLLSLAARTDMLTDLSNRRDMIEKVEAEKGRADRHDKVFSLIMMDIDHFKTINDTHGHDAGDYVLRETARTITHNLRKEDSPGRWGGEEFLVLLPETGGDNALPVAEKLRASIADQQLVYNDVPLAVTVSIGVSECRYGQSVDSCLRNSDQALYRAKQAGRNRVCLER